MGKSRKQRELPVQQLLILSICRFAEPVALSSVFPYLPEMIESFGVPKNKVARWAGITSAVFSLSQAATGIAWGRASDRFGRKPVILAGMTCTMLTSLLFGLSRSLPWAIVARSLAGAGNGNVGIIRTAVAEMVPWKELQPKAFSIMPLVWTIGSIFGPGFGGALANPAARHPEVFGNISFFQSFPFALPNLVASLFFLVGLSTGILFLKETLETKRHRRDYGRVLGKFLLSPFSRRQKKPKWQRHNEQASSLLRHSRISSVSTTNGDIRSLPDQKTVKQSRPTYREVFSHQSNINLLTYSLLALHSIAFDQLLPIFMHYPRQPNRSTNPNVCLPFKFTGGFGIDSERIGLLFTVYGICGVIIQFVAFPPLARHYGVLNCLRACTLTFPIVYLATPFTALLPTPEAQQVVMFLVMLVKCWASIFAFPCTTILLTNSAVSLRVLGTLNGVATSLSAIGRATGPAVGGWTFSVGLDKGYVITPWWTLAGFAVLGALPVWWLVEMDGFGGAGDSDSDSGSENDTVVPSATEPAGNVSSKPIAIGGTTSPREELDNGFVAEEGEPVSSHRLSKTVSHSRGTRIGHIERRMSSPVGLREAIGPGGGGKLSNGLGQSRSGFGTGGTSYS